METILYDLSHCQQRAETSEDRTQRAARESTWPEEKCGCEKASDNNVNRQSRDLKIHFVGGIASSELGVCQA